MEIIHSNVINITDNEVRTPRALAPTVQQYRTLEHLYDFFNRELFDGRLESLILSLQRQRNVAGAFCPNQYITLNGEGPRIHGLSLNPERFITDGLQELCQTLVHEQCHCADHQFGKPGRRGYHSKSWGSIMKTVGLCPSSDGTAEGAEVGYHMQEYVIKGGRFEIAFGKLMQSELVIWGDVRQQLAAEPVAPPKPPKRITFTCPSCGHVKSQAVPSMAGKLFCGPCGFRELVAA